MADVLRIEDQLYRFGIKTKKPKSKPYNEYSKCEMVMNSLIVLLWGGESFDSYESNQKLLEHRKSFKNSHRVKHNDLNNYLL